MPQDASLSTSQFAAGRAVQRREGRIPSCSRL